MERGDIEQTLAQACIRDDAAPGDPDNHLRIDVGARWKRPPSSTPSRSQYGGSAVQDLRAAVGWGNPRARTLTGQGREDKGVTTNETKTIDWCTNKGGTVKNDTKAEL